MTGHGNSHGSCPEANHDIQSAVRPQLPTLPHQRPFWDKASRTLWLGDVLVKRFKRRAPIAETILDAFQDKILVFSHDDVWIDDFFFVHRIVESLRVFDVVGVAGNTEGKATQCAWAFLDKPGQWDEQKNLSGAVAHTGKGVSWYGDVPQEVKLLDGVLMATKGSTLLRSGVRFDPVFCFHCYDMDFCRSARRQGLRLGTWPIAITHSSGGKYHSASWRSAYANYCRKWDGIPP